MKGQMDGEMATRCRGGKTDKGGKNDVKLKKRQEGCKGMEQRERLRRDEDEGGVRKRGKERSERFK